MAQPRQQQLYEHPRQTARTCLIRRGGGKHTGERGRRWGKKVSPSEAFAVEEAAAVVGGLLQCHGKNEGGEPQLKTWKNE
jgi:hypothetical protein